MFDKYLTTELIKEIRETKNVEKLLTAYLHLSADYDQLEDQYKWLKED